MVRIPSAERLVTTVREQSSDQWADVAILLLLVGALGLIALIIAFLGAFTACGFWWALRGGWHVGRWFFGGY